jgi:hypothetical protein
MGNLAPALTASTALLKYTSLNPACLRVTDQREGILELPLSLAVPQTQEEEQVVPQTQEEEQVVVVVVLQVDGMHVLVVAPVDDSWQRVSITCVPDE